MLLYADENFPLPVVEALRQIGHDVITVQEDGHSAKSDADILARAQALGRILMTHNRRRFENLHRQGASHNGILSATQDPNHAALAGRIDAALSGVTPGRWCLRVNRPAKGSTP
jgi:predicted nuclease of predicted toxin-antitoxin system